MGVCRNEKISKKYSSQIVDWDLVSHARDHILRKGHQLPSAWCAHAILAFFWNCFTCGAGLLIPHSIIVRPVQQVSTIAKNAFDRKCVPTLKTWNAWSRICVLRSAPKWSHASGKPSRAKIPEPHRRYCGYSHLFPKRHISGSLWIFSRVCPDETTRIYKTFEYFCTAKVFQKNNLSNFQKNMWF